jgi:acetyltransferase-like isoleucine patch superfamily enzyme
MHRVRKAMWGLRALFLRPFFGAFGMPSYLGPPVFLMGTRRMRIGSRVRIFPGLRAECHGEGSITIGDNVALEQSVHITAMGDLRIGTGSTVAAFAFITDIDHEYADITRSVLEQPLIYRRTEIGENCFIGIGASILPGTILGDGCIVGTNAVVRGEFPAHTVIVGVPGRAVKRYNDESGLWERV